jgi:hypothetical protein
LVAVGRRAVGFVLRVADGVVNFVGAVAGLAGRDALCVGFTVACTVTVGVTVTVGTNVAVAVGCVVAVAASGLPDEPHPPTSACRGDLVAWATDRSGSANESTTWVKSRAVAYAPAGSPVSGSGARIVMLTMP